MRKILFGVFATALVMASSTACSSQDKVDLQEFKIGDKTFQVQVAGDKEQKEKGLMGVTKLPENEGMVFKYDPAQRISFWMKDTLIPLDLAWIKDGKVIGTITMTPCIEKDPDNCTRWQSPGEVDYALEVNAGQLADVPFDSEAKLTSQ